MTYDWLIIGGGITGAALAYELVKQNFKVLLLEADQQLHNATYFSYGGLAYWSGTDQISRELAAAGIRLHRQLGKELEADTEFRELDLLLTVDLDTEPQQIAQNYQQFAIQPEILDPKTASELEPQLNHGAIAAALRLPHAQINTKKTNLAYIEAFQRLGGQLVWGQGTGFKQVQRQVRGVYTAAGETFTAAHTVVCAGGASRQLLQAQGIDLNLYYTQTQLIQTVPTKLKLQTIIMPALQQRFELESQAARPEQAGLWRQKKAQLRLNPILDAGAVQFSDGSCYLGQISEVNPNGEQINLDQRERQIRHGLKDILPAVSGLPGKCYSCTVAFSSNKIAWLGAVPNYQQIYVFSGFTSTILYAPIIARMYAGYLAGKNEPTIEQLMLESHVQV